QSSSCQLDWIIGPGITLHSSLDYRSYTGFSFEGKNTITLLNLGLGKKLFAGQKGELQFAVFDVLGENSNLSQSSTGTYIEENQSLALTRYYLLSFTYRIKNFQI
ncbi:MAG: TonB-dependent receptor, partial [Candidatus Marinimicrobia bacterium]|nr:TonB-dependent receptor [Candidatus Neomarinimicrobiota bacterium]